MGRRESIPHWRTRIRYVADKRSARDPTTEVKYQDLAHVAHTETINETGCEGARE